MTIPAAPSSRDAVARLLSERGLGEGKCLIVATARDESGTHILEARLTSDSWVKAIQLAGNMAPKERGVFVAACCNGVPVIVVRYGDVPPDLV